MIRFILKKHLCNLECTHLPEVFVYEIFLFFFPACFWTYFSALQSLGFRLLLWEVSQSATACCPPSSDILLPLLRQPTLCPSRAVLAGRRAQKPGLTSFLFIIPSSSAHARFTFGVFFSLCCFFCFFFLTHVCPELLLFCRVWYPLIPAWFLQHSTDATRRNWAISGHRFFFSFILVCVF